MTDAGLPTRAPRRVLYAYRSDIDVDGGAGNVMRETARAVQALGVEVDVTYDVRPDVRGYDLVHVFNIWAPNTALEQLEYVRGTGVPIVWSPFYLHWCEYTWANTAVRWIYGPARSTLERRAMLAEFADGRLEVAGRNRWRPNEIYPGFHREIARMLAAVDHVCVVSYHEAQMLAQLTDWVAKPFSLTPHGVDGGPFRDATPDLFRQQFNPGDFVLCVASVDGRKNQLMLVEALKETGLSVVLIGPNWEPDYLEFCLREGRGYVRYIDRVPQAVVASAYKAARVHALPSFAEGAALVNLEAAAAGCALVVSNRSSEFEYFGSAPYYCNPVDPVSIRAAVMRAYEARPADAKRWEALSRRVCEQYTWRRTAELTLEAYAQTMRDRGGLPPLQPQLGRGQGGEARTPAVGSQDVTLLPTAHCPLPSRPPTAHCPLPTRRHVGLKWESDLFDFGGRARLSRDVLAALTRRGVLATVEPYATNDHFVAQLQANPRAGRLWQPLLERRGKPPVCVCFHPPVDREGVDVFALCRRHNPGFDSYVGVATFETDRLPAGWAEACNAMDEVWVPSAFNRATFSRAGVDPARLHVIPFGVDTRMYDPAHVQPLAIPGRRGFTFLSVFQWSRRKGWDVLLKAYLSAFTPKDDVCLVLRAYPDRIKTPIRERIDRYVRQIGHDPQRVPPIVLLEDFIPDERMPALYAAADAFVLPTRGEGWGIPFMEAMAMGLPVVATRWGGYLDFMGDDNSYLIDVAGMVPVDPEQTAENALYTRDHLWAEPSPIKTAELMRRIYEGREEARAKGARARAEIRTRWHLDRTAAWIVDRLNHLAPR